ncbi:unnamed protein product, partial [Phaedon cochleariae]
ISRNHTQTTNSTIPVRSIQDYSRLLPGLTFFYKISSYQSGLFRVAIKAETRQNCHHTVFRLIEIGIPQTNNMQATLFALFALVAVSASSVVLPQTYSLGYAAPYATPYAALGYSAPWSAPLAYAATPLVYSAPAVQSGYVAATRGSVHTAPLPEGPHAFSHHLNTAPAPGTL